MLINNQNISLGWFTYLSLFTGRLGLNSEENFSLPQKVILLFFIIFKAFIIKIVLVVNAW